MPRSSSSSTVPRPSRPTASSSSVRPRSRGLWVAAGFCAHGIAGSGGMGRLMAEWIIDGQPGLDTWEMDSRRFGPQYRSRGYCPRAHDRGVRHLLRRQVPRPRAALGPAASPAPGPRATGQRSARASAKRGAGRGSTGSSRTSPPATRRCVRAAGRAGSGRRRSGPSTAPAARAAALFDETSFSKLEVIGPGAAGVLGAHVRQPRRPANPGRSPTPSCAIRPAASSATSQ